MNFPERLDVKDGMEDREYYVGLVNKFFNGKVDYCRNEAKTAESRPWDEPTLDGDSKESCELRLRTIQDYAQGLRSFNLKRHLGKVIKSPRIITQGLADVSTHIELESEFEDNEYLTSHRDLAREIFVRTCNAVFPELERVITDEATNIISHVGLLGSELKSEFLKNTLREISSNLGFEIIHTKNLNRVILLLKDAVLVCTDKMDSLYWKEDVDFDDEDDLLNMNKIIYMLFTLNERLIEENKSNTLEIDTIGNSVKKRVEKNETIEELMSYNEVANLFKSVNPTTGSIKQVVTPKVRRSILKDMLDHVDSRISAGKNIAVKSKNSILGARKMSQVLGNSSQGIVYQFIASAKENRIIDVRKISGMPINDYLMKYLDYDLNEDTKRASDLKKYTNMLS